MVPNLQWIAFMVKPALGLAFGGWLVACGGTPAAPDAGGPDGGSLGGVQVEWRAQALPLEVEDDLRIDDVAVALRTVRALGDAATGDSTTASDVMLTWAAGQAPAPIVFPDAPPGVYSALELRFGGTPTLHVDGEVLIEDTWTPFEIIDDAPTTLDLALSGELGPGERVIMAVDVNLAALVAEIDFTEVEPADDGVLRIDPSSPLIPVVRDGLEDAFEAEVEDGSAAEGSEPGDAPDET